MAKKNKQIDPLAKLVALCKRRGIVFQSSEIYGGVGSTYDYGPYGVEIKNNISRLWWDEMTRNHENIVGLDSAVILHPQVWEASGHLTHFSDPMVECRLCQARFREDLAIQRYQCDNCNKQIINISPGELDTQFAFIERYGEDILAEQLKISEQFCPNCEEIQSFTRVGVKCPYCKKEESLTTPRDFMLMFQTNMGPTAEPGSEVYLRPETCQGIFLDWKIVQESARLKVPFGIAQIGKAFRN